MQQFKILVLTDHTNHSAENSLYALLKITHLHPMCQYVDVATRGNSSNDFFFREHIPKELFVSKVDENFEFSKDGFFLNKNLKRKDVASYDVIWLRMPPPLSVDFLNFLSETFPNQLIINSPEGILETGSKRFLLNFPTVTPPMQVCNSVADIMDFKKSFPIVLKPFREYGGKGIVRIDGEKVWSANQEMTFDDFVKTLDTDNIEYLGVQYLKNVSQGDKRIVIVNGEIMGASLRLPPKDSWICNVAMGGSSNPSEVDDDEREIIHHIHPLLSKMGIVMYGVDTLVGNEGKRILSEINTTSIGGLPQIAKQVKQPLVEKAIDLIFKYVQKNKCKDVVTK